MAIIVTALLLPGAILAADPAQKPGSILYIGADDSTPLDDVALLYFNQGDEDGVRTQLGGVTPYVDGKPARKPVLVGNHGFAVAKAGRYEVGGICVISSRESLRSSVVDLEGGKRYHIRCTGRTPRTLALVATELGAVP